MSHPMAIAYSMKKKSKKFADGGDVPQPSGSPSPVPDPNTQAAKKSIGTAFGGFAKGGMVDEMSSGYEDMPEARGGHEYGEEIVDRIMRKAFSHGGQVANDTSPLADSEPAQYDDLVLDDDLHSENSGMADGDELGNAEQDHERHESDDIVGKIMSKRKKNFTVKHE